MRSRRQGTWLESVKTEFDKQPLMKTIHARLTQASPGLVEIEVPFSSSLTQQHGYMHAAVVSGIADTACGYAAWTAAGEGSEVLTVEFKISFLSPSTGSKLTTRAFVLHRGRTLITCLANVFASYEGREVHTATMLATVSARVKSP